MKFLDLICPIKLNNQCHVNQFGTLPSCVCHVINRSNNDKNVGHINIIKNVIASVIIINYQVVGCISFVNGDTIYSTVDIDSGFCFG